MLMCSLSLSRSILSLSQTMELLGNFKKKLFTARLGEGEGGGEEEEEREKAKRDFSW